MSPRTLAMEVAVLGAVVIWVYAGVAVVVAQLGEGQAISIGAVLAVVLLAHILARMLSRFDLSENTMRAVGAVVSVALFYLILRIEIAGDPYIWDLTWLVDLITDRGGTLEGHAGDVAGVILLGVAWIYGVARGSQARTVEGVAGDASIGLGVVLFAALFAGSANAPEIVGWLPVPYMAVALLALALVYMASVGMDRARPFAGAWGLWVVGSVLLIAAIALPMALIDLEALGFIGTGIGLIGKGIGLVLLAVMLPPLIGLAWLIEQLLSFGMGGEAFTPDVPTTEELNELLEDNDEEKASWTKVFGFILRFGFLALAIALAFALLWLAFQRVTKRDEDDVDSREEIDADGLGGGLGSLLGGTLGRLRDRFSGGQRGSDAVGRLYLSMLRRAEDQGLPRPAAATPREFAPSLDTHFASKVPSSISLAYATARYSGRSAPEDEVTRLTTEWREVERRIPPDEPG